jgi:hypothetical protein
MMRLARRASLLASFSLLALATTAYAECAWVLWTQANESTNWKPISGWDSRSSCEEVRQGVAYKHLNTLGVMVERTDVTYTCPPDTVYPRGPKGK